MFEAVRDRMVDFYHRTLLWVLERQRATLVVQDDGAGFEPAQVSVPQPGAYLVRLTNDGAVMHDLVDVDGDPAVGPCREGGRRHPRVDLRELAHALNHGHRDQRPDHDAEEHQGEGV